MCYSLNRIATLQTGFNYLLGFNEPDNVKETNITTADAIKNWPLLYGKSNILVSPAIAGNLLTVDNWMDIFSKQTTIQYDRIAVHWYKGVDYKKFKSDMTAIYNKFKKPLWITEFAPQTVSSSTATPGKYSQSEVDTFIKEVVSWMRKTQFIERYAWHDSKIGTSQLIDSNGQLTASGLTYALA